MTTTRFACFVVLQLMFALPEAAVAQASSSCDEPYVFLGAFPHSALSMAQGRFASTWSGAPFDGCEIRFETSTSLLGRLPPPDLFADPGSELFERGWRTDPLILADGPGSGVYAIERRATHCVVRWDQSSYIDDDGELVVSENFTMLVQCTERTG